MCTVIVSATLLFFLSTSGHVDFFFSQNALVLSTKQNLFPFLTFTHFGSCQCIPLVSSIIPMPLFILIFWNSGVILPVIHIVVCALWVHKSCRCFNDLGALHFQLWSCSDSLRSLWRFFGNDDRPYTLHCTACISITPVDLFPVVLCDGLSRDTRVFPT